ncbi:MAG: hypothetical protein ABWZ42_11310 [Ilumatobacteraceae bacterium]
MYDDILYDVDDPVAVITLNRPDALNAWTNSMGDEIADAMQRAAADPMRSSSPRSRSEV